jgi:hypothetical protein
MRIDRSLLQIYTEHELQIERDIPKEVKNGAKLYITVNPSDMNYYTHPMFKFPARFFPLVPRWAIAQYSVVKGLVMDPFCGAGGALVETKLANRRAIGLDIDPLGRFLTKVKTTPVEPRVLRSRWEELRAVLDKIRRDRPYDPTKLAFKDLSKNETNQEIQRTQLKPYLPTDENRPPYWFRNYVLLDLARVKKAILETGAASDGNMTDFLMACLAATIRKTSNADPSAVSGLEYTKVMREWDEQGRVIDVIRAFEERVEERIPQMSNFYEECSRRGTLLVPAQVIGADVRRLKEYFNKEGLQEESVDLVLTSPPYCGAIEYYRRHKLELVWLGLAKDFDAVRELSTYYIGTYNVKGRVLTDGQQIPQLTAVLNHVRRANPRRAYSISKYFTDMAKAFEMISWSLKRNGCCVVVIGDSTGQGMRIPTADIYIELARRRALSLEKEFSYVIRNRIMEFPRGARGGKIDFEKILVFRKT